MSTNRSRWLAVLGCTALLAVAMTVVAERADAATIAVTATTDSGPGSLREAFAVANVSGDTSIELQADAEYVLTCAGGGDLDHASATGVFIRGNHATIRQECPGERVIDSSGGGNFDLDQTNVTGGSVTGVSEPGGGIRVTGVAIIERSTITGNSTEAQGGGLSIEGGGMITSTVVSGNTAGGGGGGAFVPAPLTVGMSRFSDNHALGGGGGGLLVGGRLSVQDSTVDGNTAGDAGGGIFNLQVADTLILQSTVTGNTSIAPGGGIIVAGGIELRHATIVANRAPVASNLFYNQDRPVVMFGSVIAAPRNGSNCFFVNTPVTSYNFSDDDSCQLADPTDSTSAGTPMLGPLQDNGGATPTLLPAIDSPLIDRIPVDEAAEICGGDDQRGVLRPVGPACDIGSVELDADPPFSEPPATTAGPDTAPLGANTPTRPQFAG